MEKKKKAIMVTKAVAWTNGKPTKYQSTMEYPLNEKRTIRILGDPQPSEDKAVDSLIVEHANWKEAMSAFDECMERMA